MLTSDFRLLTSLLFLRHDSSIMLVAIGSTRGPKVEAAKEITTLLMTRGFFTECGALEFLERDAPSGVSKMPLSFDELMAGARHRAEYLQRELSVEGRSADFYLGMEGGFVVFQERRTRRCFLQNWAYVSNGNRGTYGASGAIAIPETIVHEVVDRGRELADVIDEFANRRDVRSNEGTWGILTLDLILRKDAFKIALLNAFAPFYNPRAYCSEAF